jgi:hypothetical protein
LLCLFCGVFWSEIRTAFLLIRKGRFARILESGEHWIFGAGVETATFNISDWVFENAWAGYIMKERACRADFPRRKTRAHPRTREACVVLGSP